jgi:hypothetical protein
MGHKAWFWQLISTHYIKVKIIRMKPVLSDLAEEVVKMVVRREKIKKE